MNFGNREVNTYNDQFVKDKSGPPRFAQTTIHVITSPSFEKISS